MKYLIDEQLSEEVALSMSILGSTHGDHFDHIVTIGHGGALDPDIPDLCRNRGMDVLVSMNVRDFGARVHYYGALLKRGLHVVILRPGKVQPDAGQQLGLLAQHSTSIRRRLVAAVGPTLLVATAGAIRERSLEDLVVEITGLP